MSIFEKGVCISENPNPDTSDYSPVGGINTPGEYNTSVSGLNPATKYYIKAFVHTDMGYFYGDEDSFMTLPVEVFTDPRDGQEYYYIEYRNNSWMVSNLDFDIEGSFYFNNDSARYAAEYGRLYDYEAAVAACPAGWKLPEDEDWKLLEIELGMDISAANAEGPRGSNEGCQLKEPGNRLWEGYENNKTSTNSSGFTAKPAGFYNFGDNKFSNEGQTGYCTVYWSTANELDVSYVRTLSSHLGDISRTPTGKTARFAFSVRCVKIK